MNEEVYRAIGSGFKFGHDPSSWILRAAVDLLDRNYWVQGTTATTYISEPDRRRYDLIGAVIATTGFEIREAHYEGRASAPSRKGEYFQKRNNYETWSSLIGRRGKQGFLRCLAYVTEVTGEIDVEHYNDAVATCKDDVLGALTAAADLAEARGD